MPPEPEADHFLIQPQPDPRQRLTDGGPRYQETPLDPALLAAFRQQGAAIVAHERGLSAACRITFRPSSPMP